MSSGSIAMITSATRAPEARRPPCAGLRKPVRDQPMPYLGRRVCNPPKRRKRETDVIKKYGPHPSPIRASRIQDSNGVTFPPTTAISTQTQHPERIRPPDSCRHTAESSDRRETTAIGTSRRTPASLCGGTDSQVCERKLETYPRAQHALADLGTTIKMEADRLASARS